MDIQSEQEKQVIEQKKSSEEVINETEIAVNKSVDSIKCGKISELRVHRPQHQATNINNGVKLHGYDFFKKLGSPQYVCAPMVDQSELAFRMLCRKYGTTLAYTPMIHSKVLMDQGYGYLNTVFSTAEEDRPLIAQFCGNNPDTLLAACKFVEDKCDAIDINFGCPQGIAKRGRYGSFLLSEPDTIVALVKKLHENLSIPVTCKIRMLPNPQVTIDLAKRIESAGCSILTIHGRTKEQNKDTVGLCDWDIIKQIKEELSIPVFANGGIYTFEDVQKCLEYTGVDGVMSAESLLENPALFSGQIYDLDDIALDYLAMTEKYPTPHFFSKGHIFKFLHQGLQIHTDLRSKLANIKTIEEQKEIVLEMKRRREHLTKQEKFGWYTRYWDKMGVKKDVYNQGCEGWQDVYKKGCCDELDDIQNIQKKEVGIHANHKSIVDKQQSIQKQSNLDTINNPEQQILEQNQLNSDQN